MFDFYKKASRSKLYSLRKYIYPHFDVRGEFERAKVSYYIAAYAAGACFFFAVLNLFLGVLFNAAVDLTAGVFFLLCIFLFINGKMNTAKFLSVLTSNICLVITASSEGREAGNQFVFFPILCGIFIIFSAREKPKIALSLIFTFASISFLESTNYSLLLASPALGESIRINSICNFTISAGLICFYVFNLIKTNNISRIKLNKLNKRLTRGKRQLEKVNTELDSFVYKASHDLRAPLTSMMGLINLMKSENNLTQIVAYLQLQEKSLLRLDSYIIDILNISRNSRLGLEINEIEFTGLIEETFSQLSHLPDYDKIQKRVSIVQPVKFYNDTKRLIVILNNLISNCIRYSDGNKPVQEIKIDIEVNAQCTVIKVYDNGIGIRKEYINRIYDMFFRATDNKSGSGLGLYIVKETLLKMSGLIEINSEIGAFTEFRIVLPNMQSMYQPALR